MDVIVAGDVYWVKERYYKDKMRIKMSHLTDYIER